MRIRSAIALIFALLAACVSTAYAQRSALARWGLTSAHEGLGIIGGGGDAVACGEDPDWYPLYDTFDRNCAPWNSTSGPWGGQVTLDAPDPPTTTSSSNASTASAFNAAAAISGRQITITADLDPDTNLVVQANDVEVIVNGHTVGSIEYGAYPHTTAWARLRIRGSLDGIARGVVGQIRGDSATTDVIVDGVDVNGWRSGGGRQAFVLNSTRVAVLNTRALSESFCWESSAHHVFIGNSNFYCGAQAKTSSTDPGWAFRNAGGPLTIVDSHLEATRYVTIRAQSTNAASEVLYVSNSVIVERAERGLFWFWDGVGNCPSCVGDGAVVEDSDLYGYAAGGSCTGSAEIMMGGGYPSCAHSAYTLIRNNAFYSAGTTAWSQSTLDSNETTCTTSPWSRDADFGTGNTFAAWTTGPAWGGPGDPRVIPLHSTSQVTISAVSGSTNITINSGSSWTPLVGDALSQSSVLYDVTGVTDSTHFAVATTGLTTGSASPIVNGEAACRGFTP